LLLADVSDTAAKALQAEKGGRVVGLQEASGADIVCTSTPVRAPIVKREWLKPGAHINAMGADAPGKQELDPRILTDGRVFIDDTEQATHSGEVNVPLHDGLFKEEQIAGTLGEVVAGRKPGRTGDEITVFDSTGLALQDVALARALYDVALQRGVGQQLDIVGS
jgi:ornithine cyclodeaminase/alanine dehydrogenase